MIRTEKITVAKMIYMYCSAKHGTEHHLCAECEKLNGYAQHRLSRCKYGDKKPACRICKTHCYRLDMQEQIRIVMRYSGPRLLFHNPKLAIKHIIQSFSF